MKKIQIIISLFLVFNISGYTQDILELTLDEAIKYAIENNKNIENASLSIKESQYSINEAISNGLPQVDAKLDYQNFFNASASIGPMSFEFNPTSNLNFQVGQLIFSGNYIVGIQMAKLYNEISKVSYKKTEADIKSQVKNAYYLVLISKNSKELLEKNYENIIEVILKTEALVSVGILDETDGDQIKLQEINLKNAINSAKRQLELANNLLRMQLGVGADKEIILKDELLDLLARANVETLLDFSFDTSENMDFQIMMIQKKIAEKKLNLEKSKFLPTVTGFYSHTEKIKAPELDFNPKNVIGFNVSIPIFSSGVRYFSHSKAKVQLLKAENQIHLTSDQLSVREKQLKQNLKSAIEQFNSQKENVELANKVFNNMYLKFQQGMISGLDLTTSNTNLLQAENSYIMTIMQMLDAKVELDKFYNKL